MVPPGRGYAVRRGAPPRLARAQAPHRQKKLGFRATNACGASATLTKRNANPALSAPAATGLHVEDMKMRGGHVRHGRPLWPRLSCPVWCPQCGPGPGPPCENTRKSSKNAGGAQKQLRDAIQTQSCPHPLQWACTLKLVKTRGAWPCVPPLPYPPSSPSPGRRYALRCAAPIGRVSAYSCTFA